MRRVCSDEELSGQRLLDYVSEFVEVQYVQAPCDGRDDEVEAPPAAASLLHRIRLMNVGLRQVVGGAWTIYFNHCGDIDKMVFDDGSVAVRHVDHWLFTLTLQPGRVLEPLTNMTLGNPVRLPARSYAFPRWYRLPRNSLRR